MKVPSGLQRMPPLCTRLAEPPGCVQLLGSYGVPSTLINQAFLQDPCKFCILALNQTLKTEMWYKWKSMQSSGCDACYAKLPADRGFSKP